MVKFKLLWIIGTIALGFLSISLVACEPLATTSPIDKSSACTSATPDANKDKIRGRTQVENLYSTLFSDQVNYNPNMLQPVKDQAFALLTDQVQHWSSANDIPVDN